MVIENSVTNYYHKGQTRAKIKLDLMIYDILCRYVLQSSSILRIDHLNNLRKLMVLIDPSVYENDPEIIKRVNFIFKALEARIDNNLTDRDIILTYINGGLTYKVNFLDYDRIELSKDELIYVNNLISETLQYQFMYQKIDEIQDLCTRFKVSDFSTRGGIVKEFERLLDDTKKEFRRTRVNDNSVDMVFSLRDGDFENAIKNTWSMITNPSRRLITGMQGLNEMTGGGFESGRVYMLLGTSGVGKSITLLNLIYQMKRFNAHYKPKDPSKTPCIVLLTMENTVVETITRLFDLVIEGSHGMANYSVNEILELLRTQGELCLNDSSPIDIVIKYKANKSVDTSYLYTLYDDLDDEGYEVICLVQDHVKRIKSMFGNSDLRIELGDVVNELKVFAAIKDIPVLTNSHLNRDAAKILEEAARKANQDAGRLLGKSNIGESMLMIDNLDCAMIIALDFDKDENKYMTFNLVKMRDKTNRIYIAQPFTPGSGIRLMDDVGGIPQFKESIHTAPEIKRNTIIKMSGASSMMPDDIDTVIDFNAEDMKDNAFSGQNYSLYPGSEHNNVIIKPIEFIETQSNNFKNNILEFKSQLNNSNPAVSSKIVPIIFGDGIYTPEEEMLWG